MMELQNIRNFLNSLEINYKDSDLDDMKLFLANKELIEKNSNYK